MPDYGRRPETACGLTHRMIAEYLVSLGRRYTLFGPEDRVVKASVDVIGSYFNDRLREVFPGVAEQPGVLRNSANCALYLFCFAAGNKYGTRSR